MSKTLLRSQSGAESSSYPQRCASFQNRCHTQKQFQGHWSKFYSKELTGLQDNVGHLKTVEQRGKMVASRLRGSTCPLPGVTFGFSTEYRHPQVLGDIHKTETCGSILHPQRPSRASSRRAGVPVASHLCTTPNLPDFVRITREYIYGGP